MKKILSNCLMLLSLLILWDCREAEATDKEVDSAQEIKALIQTKNEEIEQLMAAGNMDSVSVFMQMQSCKCLLIMNRRLVSKSLESIGTIFSIWKMDL